MKRVAEKDKFKRKEIVERLKEQKDGAYSLEIKRYWKKTEAQQGYYWWVVLETIAQETWFAGVQWFYLWWTPIIMDWKEYLHAVMKGLLQKTSSKNMTKFEYSELIETAIEVAETLWIKVPPPYTSF